MNTIQNIRSIVSAEFTQFEKYFANILHTDVPVLTEMFNHILTHRGKQLRPLLTLLSGKICGNINSKTISTAVVLELMHSASLLHDDVIDDSDSRHGQPSANRLWSNKLAILAGDYMLASAMKELTRMHNIRIQQLVCDMSHTLSQGEVLELHHDSSMWISENLYFEIIRCKTASLFATCTEAGAISVGATGYQSSKLRRFGEELGICFQLQDDIFDYSENDQLGKPTMSDIRDHKATLPLIKALQRAPRQEADSLKQRIENDPFDWTLENDIKSFVLRYDGIRYAQQQIQEHKQTARQQLAVFHPISAAYEALLQLLDFTTQRTY